MNERLFVRLETSLNVVEGCQWPRFIEQYLRPSKKRDLMKLEIQAQGRHQHPVELKGVRFRYFPTPAVWTAAWSSSVMALAPRCQMRGLETTSTTRRNGRGPDSSLISPSTFVCTRRSLTESR